MRQDMEGGLANALFSGGYSHGVMETWLSSVVMDYFHFVKNTKSKFMPHLTSHIAKKYHMKDLLGEGVVEYTMAKMLSVIPRFFQIKFLESRMKHWEDKVFPGDKMVELREKRTFRKSIVNVIKGRLSGAKQF